MRVEKGQTRPASPLTTVLRELAEKLAADDWMRCATSDDQSFYYILGMKAHVDEQGGSDHMSLSIPRGAPASAYGEYLVHGQVAARKSSDYYTRHAVSRLAGYGVDVDRLNELVKDASVDLSFLRGHIAEHNAGKCAHTSSGRPWQLDVVLKFADERRAVAFERYLESGSGNAFALRHLR